MWRPHLSFPIIPGRRVSSPAGLREPALGHPEACVRNGPCDSGGPSFWSKSFFFFFFLPRELALGGISVASIDIASSRHVSAPCEHGLVPVGEGFKSSLKRKEPYAGSNLPGIASQFANQILGTANQLRNAEQKSANQKNHLRSGAIDASHLIRSSLRDRNRQHDQPETTYPPRRSPAPVLNSRRVVYC